MEHKMRAGREKKLKRKEELAKKKMVEEVVKVAYAKKDHLLDFSPFQKYDRNGITVRLETAYGDGLSCPLKEYIVQLLKINMEGPYGPEWSAEEKVKRREMVDPQARYLIVRKENFNDEHKKLWKEDGDPVVGFVQYRFVIEEELPVQYVYELQLEKPIQGRGLGKFLMQLLELIARKNNMKAVMLTVQKRNTHAFGFYTSRMRYNISSVSPSRVDPMIDSTYEILCKTFEPEAKSKLEESNDTELGY